MSRICGTNGDKRNSYRIFLGKPEGKRSLRKPRCRCVENIKMNLRGTGWDGMDWICLTKDRGQWRALVKKIMNLQAP
jgi:hypothetical protein